MIDFIEKPYFNHSSHRNHRLAPVLHQSHLVITLFLDLIMSSTALNLVMTVNLNLIMTTDLSLIIITDLKLVMTINLNLIITINLNLIMTSVLKFSPVQSFTQF